MTRTETTTALVMTAPDEPLLLTEIDVDPPAANEVRVRIEVAGICHSDAATLAGTFPAVVPMVLGHEGAGTVEAVGPGVTHLEVGDRVVLTNSVQCGSCHECVLGRPYLCEGARLAREKGGLLDGTHRARWQGIGLSQLALSGTFAGLTVVPADSAIRIPDELSAAAAALISCAVLTGFGAAVNTATITPGETVAVLGCGGVGLNILQGARLAGAGRILAVDRDPERKGLAFTFGATDFAGSVAEALELTDGRGTDWAYDVVATASTLQDVLALTARGGTMIVVGLPDPTLRLEVPVLATLLADDKTIRASWYGSTDVRRDVPRIVRHHLDGELRIDELMSHRVSLAEAVGIIAGSDHRPGIRTLIDF